MVGGVLFSCGIFVFWFGFAAIAYAYMQRHFLILHVSS